jgi:hypothetical protein
MYVLCYTYGHVQPTHRVNEIGGGLAIFDKVFIPFFISVATNFYFLVS